MPYVPKKKVMYEKNDWTMVSKSTMLSKKTARQLEEISRDMRVPISTLIARAIRNELACQNPFEFKPDIPDESIFPDEITSTVESQKLFDYVKKHPGMNLEQLISVRDEYGVDTEEEVILAYVFLKKINVILEYYPIRSKFSHPLDYRVIKVHPNQIPRHKDILRKYNEVSKLDQGEKPIPLNEVEYED